MLDDGISEKELYAVECQVRIAHDLIESDVMLRKIDEMQNGKQGMRDGDIEKPFGVSSASKL